jgi:hypothetical protein
MSHARYFSHAAQKYSFDVENEIKWSLLFAIINIITVPVRKLLLFSQQCEMFSLKFSQWAKTISSGIMINDFELKIRRESSFIYLVAL